MVSEVDQIKRFLRQQGSNVVQPPIESRDPAAQAWLFDGGVAPSGIKYAPPDRAVAWGTVGCPLLPREVREHHKGVKLPKDLQTILGASLTVDQLDSGTIEQLSTDEVWQPPPREFRDFLYSLPVLAAQVAIPAGVPLLWIEDLPITGRTRGAVRRAFREAGADVFRRAPMLARQFLEIRSVGLIALNELACVMETAELGHVGQDPTFDLDSAGLRQEALEYEDQVNAAAVQIVESMSSFNKRLSGFAGWAMAETDAQTFGEAIAELIRAGAGNEAWKPVAAASLTELAARLPHPYEVLDNWIEQLDKRSKSIFMARVSSHPNSMLTLEDLGAEFSVTRERIRQLEAKTRRSLYGFLHSDEALPVRWRASTLRQILSVAAPVDTVEHLLRPPPGSNDHRTILLAMAGPYDRDNDWLTLRSAQQSDPTPIILSQVDDAGRINREFAISQLNAWGLDGSLHDRWLARDGSVRLFNGQLVRWGTSISDRLVFALADMGQPATVDEMVTHVGEDRLPNSINTALAQDPRLVKVSRTRWALAPWGLTEYSGVAESMRNLLEELGGPVALDEVVGRMHRTFGVAENSVLAYCSAPMFVVEGRSLRLRTQHDRSYQFDQDLIERTPGVFYLGPVRLGRLLKVDKNILRGSGAFLTHAAGAILDVEVNADLSFTNKNGDHVRVTFPETSHVGPTLGSVRQITERLSAKEDEYLTLILDRSQMTVTALLTDLRDWSPGWNVIGRLTGIDETADLDRLADALQCKPGEVRSVLKARGDDDILAFLPGSEASSSLDEALAALEDHIEQFRGEPQ